MNLFGRTTRGSTPPPPWLPTDIGVCKFWGRSDLAWQDAAKTVPCTNESLIWVGEDKRETDKHDIIQATDAKKPVYFTNQVNGHPSKRFDGIDDYLKAITFTLSRPCEIYLVVKVITLGYYYLFDGNAGNDMALVLTGATTINQYAGGWGSALTYAPGFIGNWVLIQALYGNTDVNASLLRVNGGSPVAGTLGVSTTPNGFTLGAYGQGVAVFANIDVAEVVIYEPGLSDADRQRLELYFNTESQGTGYNLF